MHKLCSVVALLTVVQAVEADSLVKEDAAPSGGLFVHEETGNLHLDAPPGKAVLINSVDLPASLTKLEETLLEANSALETKHLAEVEARKQLEERVVALETFIASTSTTATTSTVTATSTTVTTGTATTTTVPYVPVACHGVAESPGCGTRIPVADCAEGGEHESFARANCPSMCGLACTSTSTTVSSTTTVTTTSVTTTTVNEDGTLQGTGNNCKEIKDANRNAKSGKYELNVLGNLQVYCDMDTDGGGWTLVMRSNNEKDITEEDASAHGDVAALQDLKGASAKYSDAFINKLKSGSSERIGYRSTSFRIDSKYFHPGSCKYHHGSLDNNFNDKACMRYRTSWSTNTSPSYVQCGAWGGYAGGINCWYQCNGSGGYTNVVVTHARDHGGARITTNGAGGTLGSSGTSYKNSVLLWVL